jgi:uncharacterized protein YdhG (YjbR/CyaY superfamily)
MEKPMTYSCEEIDEALSNLAQTLHLTAASTKACIDFVSEIYPDAHKRIKEYTEKYLKQIEEIVKDSQVKGAPKCG